MREEAVRLIEEFALVLHEDSSKFPCRAKFAKIGEELASFKSDISGGTLPDPLVKEAKDLLSELNGLLKECQELKDEEGSRGCLGDRIQRIPFRTGQRKALSVQRRLSKLAKRLETISSGAAHCAGAAGEKGDEPQQSYVRPEIRDYEWTSSFIERERIYGMDAQVKEIVDHLDKTTCFDAVGIVGMQGTGKTALAQKVFTDERILDKFAMRLWVCVSPHKCKPKEVLERMLDSLGFDVEEVDKIAKDSGKEEVGVFLFVLYMALLDNSYLIVFDDVRSSKDDDWYRDLSQPAPMDKEWTQRLAYGLPKGDLGGGSAVIVTSRSEDMARAMVGSGGVVFRTRPLQDDLLPEGWKVFKAAFKDEAPELKMDPEWKKLKRLIVEKCNGLPLALKVAGRELARRQQKGEDEEGETLLQPDDGALASPDHITTSGITPLPAAAEASRLHPGAATEAPHAQPEADSDSVTSLPAMEEDMEAPHAQPEADSDSVTSLPAMEAPHAQPEADTDTTTADITPRLPAAAEASRLHPAAARKAPHAQRDTNAVTSLPTTKASHAQPEADSDSDSVASSDGSPSTSPDGSPITSPRTAPAQADTPHAQMEADTVTNTVTSLPARKAPHAQPDTNAITSLQATKASHAQPEADSDSDSVASSDGSTSTSPAQVDTTSLSEGSPVTGPRMAPPQVDTTSSDDSPVMSPKIAPAQVDTISLSEGNPITSPRMISAQTDTTSLSEGSPVTSPRAAPAQADTSSLSEDEAPLRPPTVGSGSDPQKTLSSST